MADPPINLTSFLFMQFFFFLKIDQIIGWRPHLWGSTHRLGNPGSATESLIFHHVKNYMLLLLCLSVCLFSEKSHFIFRLSKLSWCKYLLSMIIVTISYAQGGASFRKQTGEEITSTNSTDINVNDKPQKCTCCDLLLLSRGNGKKKLSLFTRTVQQICSFPYRYIIMWLDRKGALFYTFQFGKWEFSISS